MARKMTATDSPDTFHLTWAFEDGSSPNPVAKRSRLPRRSDMVKDDYRQRKAHRKVRTGCLTCKIRRKKCDEAKPECQRCRSTGRVCDGYSSPVTSTTFAERSPSSSTSLTTSAVIGDGNALSVITKWSETSTKPTANHPTSFNHPSRPLSTFATLGPLTDLDRHCFTYFCHRTLPQFMTYFESIIWRSSSIRGINHPALFSAAVALGAVHLRFCYGISREAFEYCAHADKLHKKAIHQLEILKDQKFYGAHSHQDDHVFLVETLLSMFQAFQGNPDVATEHMNTALYHFIRGSPFKMIRSEKRYCMAKSTPGLFSRLFHALYCRLTELLDSPITILVKTSDRRPLPVIPDIFQNLEDARDYLFTEVDWFTHTPARWEDFPTRNQALDFHVERLTQWTRAYTRTVSNMTRIPRQERACTLLKLARNAAYVLIFRTLFADAEQYPPNFLPDFEDDSSEDEDPALKTAIQILGEAQTTVGAGNANLSSIKLIVEALLAHKALLDPADELIDSRIQQSHYPCESSEVGVYTVANQITLTADEILFKLLGAILPDHIDMTLPDVTCMVEERIMLMRYYSPHPDGVGLWWTQEWWTFERRKIPLIELLDLCWEEELVFACLDLCHVCSVP